MARGPEKLMGPSIELFYWAGGCEWCKCAACGMTRFSFIRSLWRGVSGNIFLSMCRRMPLHCCVFHWNCSFCGSKVQIRVELLSSVGWLGLEVVGQILVGLYSPCLVQKRSPHRFLHRVMFILQVWLGLIILFFQFIMEVKILVSLIVVFFTNH